MSIDTHIQLRTASTDMQIRRALVDDAALTDLTLVDKPEKVEVVGKNICVVIQPWAGDDHALIDNGFETANIFCKTIPGRGDAGWEAQARVIAAILRLVSGDVCLANQDSAGPDLLRLDGTVYSDPEAYPLRDLTDFGYTPVSYVIGIPERRS